MSYQQGANAIPDAVNEIGNYYLTEQMLPKGDRNSKLAVLSADGRVDPDYMPHTYQVDTKAQMTALAGAVELDFCIVTKDPNALLKGTYQYIKTGGILTWTPFGGGAGSITAATISYGGTETDILNASQGKMSFAISNAAANGLKLVWDAASKTLSGSLGQATGSAFGAAKIADAISGSVAAASGIAASPKAVADYVGTAVAGLITKVTINGVAKTTTDKNLVLDIVEGRGINVATDANGKVTIFYDAAELKTDLGLGTAAYKNTGTAAGNIPLLDANGKLPDSVISSLFSTEFVQCSDAAVTTLAQLVTWIKAQPVQRGDMVIVSNNVKAVTGKYVIGAELAALTEATLYDLGTPDEMVVTVNGLAYTARNGVITISANLVSNVTVTGTGSSALVITRNVVAATGECTVNIEVKTATSSQYGVVKVSDNYAAAASDIAASLKAVNDALTAAKTYSDGKIGTTAITTWGATLTAAISAIGTSQVTTISKSADSSAGWSLAKNGNTYTLTLKNASASWPGLVTMATGAATSTVYDTNQVDDKISNTASGKAAKGTYVVSKVQFTSANVSDTGEYTINRLVPIITIVLSDGTKVMAPVTYGASSVTIRLWGAYSNRATVYGGLFSAANAAKVHSLYVGEVVL